MKIIIDREIRDSIASHAARHVKAVIAEFNKSMETKPDGFDVSGMHCFQKFLASDGGWQVELHISIDPLKQLTEEVNAD